MDQPSSWGPAAPLGAPAVAGGMKPLEKFLKKQGSHLATRAVPGSGGQLSRRQSVSKILPGFLKEPPEDLTEGGTETTGDGRWLELRAPDSSLRSPTSFSSEELSPGGGGGGETQLSPESVPTCCWVPLAEPESPDRIVGRVLERLGGDPTAPHGHGCGAGKGSTGGTSGEGWDCCQDGGGDSSCKRGRGGYCHQAGAKGIKRLWGGLRLMVGVLYRSACFNCK